MRNDTHPGPTLATSTRLRELVRLIGPRWDVLGLLDAVLYDWDPRLAALVPPMPASGPAAVVEAEVRPQLVFGEPVPYALQRKAKRR